MDNEKFKRFLVESSPEKIQEFIEALQIYDDEELNEIVQCLIIVT